MTTCLTKGMFEHLHGTLQCEGMYAQGLFQELVQLKDMKFM